MLFNSGNLGKGADQGREKQSWSAWLDAAQRETWQMELLLSGFAIVLLAQVKNPLNEWLDVLRLNAGVARVGKSLVGGLEIMLPNAWLVVTTSLVFGVVMRALWISAIGLRSVSGEIELEALRLAPKFKRFLDKRIGSYDDYIMKLENACSLLFGLTFLLVFAIIGISVVLTGYTLLFAGAGFLIDQLVPDGQSEALKLRFATLFSMLVMLPVLLLYLVDFISGSSVKRSVGFAKFYYPIYRVLGWLMLARFYRPLYYNFIDNKIGRNAILYLIPYAVVLLVALQFNNSSFSPLRVNSESIIYGRSSAYLDSFQGGSARSPKLPSKFVKGSYLELYVPLGGNFYEALDSVCYEQARAYTKLKYLKTRDPDQLAKYVALLSCMSVAYEVYVDEQQLELTTPIFAEEDGLYGAFMIFSVAVDSLATGGHILHLSPAWTTENVERLTYTIPFIKQ